MRYCESMNEILYKKNPQVKEFSEINNEVKFKELELISICQHLIYANIKLHSKGIVHRDIKPSNMLFMSERFEDYGSLKFCDYGSSLWIGNLSDQSKIRKTIKSIYQEGT